MIPFGHPAGTSQKNIDPGKLKRMVLSVRGEVKVARRAGEDGVTRTIGLSGEFGQADPANLRASDRQYHSSRCPTLSRLLVLCLQVIYDAQVGRSRLRHSIRKGLPQKPPTDINCACSILFELTSVHDLIHHESSSGEIVLFSSYPFFAPTFPHIRLSVLLDLKCKFCPLSRPFHARRMTDGDKWGGVLRVYMQLRWSSSDCVNKCTYTLPLQPT